MYFSDWFIIINYFVLFLLLKHFFTGCLPDKARSLKFTCSLRIVVKTVTEWILIPASFKPAFTKVRRLQGNFIIINKKGNKL